MEKFLGQYHSASFRARHIHILHVDRSQPWRYSPHRAVVPAVLGQPTFVPSTRFSFCAVSHLAPPPIHPIWCISLDAKYEYSPATEGQLFSVVEDQQASLLLLLARSRS